MTTSSSEGSAGGVHEETSMTLTSSSTADRRCSQDVRKHSQHKQEKASVYDLECAAKGETLEISISKLSVFNYSQYL